MKKLFFLLLFTIAVFTVQSENIWFTTTHYSIKAVENGTWSNWVPVKIPVMINIDQQHIEIYSQKTQILDLEDLIKERFSRGVTYSAFATDSNYKRILITLSFYDNGNLTLGIIYNDIMYRYKLDSY